MKTFENNNENFNMKPLKNKRILIIIILIFFLIALCFIVSTKIIEQEQEQKKQQSSLLENNKEIIENIKEEKNGVQDVVNISENEIEEVNEQQSSLVENNEEITENIKEEIYEMQDNDNILKNEIEDEYIGYSVIYSVPSEFKFTGKTSVDFGSTNYYSLEHNDNESNIYAEVSIFNKEKYKNGVVDVTYNNYKGMNYNVNMKEEILRAYEKEFECTIIDAQLNETYGTKEMVIYYNLDEINIFVVHLNGKNEEITEDLAEKFLNIVVKEIE